jgi:hypothetical protein
LQPVERHVLDPDVNFGRGCVGKEAFDDLALLLDAVVCGSVRVAQGVVKWRSRNIRIPPSRLERRLNVAAPRHMTKKNPDSETAF